MSVARLGLAVTNVFLFVQVPCAAVVAETEREPAGGAGGVRRRRPGRRGAGDEDDMTTNYSYILHRVSFHQSPTRRRESQQYSLTVFIHTTQSYGYSEVYSYKDHIHCGAEKVVGC